MLLHDLKVFGCQIKPVARVSVVKHQSDITELQVTEFLQGRHERLVSSRKVLEHYFSSKS